MTPVLFHPDLGSVLTLLVAVVLPILVGLVTTRVVSAALKAVLLAGLSLVTSIISTWLTAIQADKPFDLYAALITFGGVFLIAVASYFGFWKPTGVSVKAQDLGTSGKHIDAGTSNTSEPSTITSLSPSVDPATTSGAATPSTDPDVLATQEALDKAKRTMN